VGPATHSMLIASGRRWLDRPGHATPSHAAFVIQRALLRSLIYLRVQPDRRKLLAVANIFARAGRDAH
jgi:hypothetical protein